MLHQSDCAVACGLILVTVEDWDLNKKSPNHLFVFWKKRFLYWQTDNYCACHFLTLSPMTCCIELLSYGQQEENHSITCLLMMGGPLG